MSIRVLHDPQRLVDEGPGEERQAKRPSPPGVVSRAWRARVRVHLAVLALVLVALIPVIGTATSFSADEGAAIIEARSLSAGHGWTVAHPFPQADPSGKAYPIELSQSGARGVAPFAKHPLYALLLAGADLVGGMVGLVLLSVAGTVVAAALAAALARRLDPCLSRPAVWVVGLASPLFFDGYLVIAHTLGAAFAAGAVLFAVRAIERQRPTAAVGVGLCVLGAVLLRNEALFFALGLAVSVGVLAVRRRRCRAAALAVAAAAVTSAAAAHIGETIWMRHLLGAGGPTMGTPLGSTDMGFVAGRARGFVAGRARGFVVTWLLPGYSARTVTELALVTMVWSVVVGALAIRRNRPFAPAAVVAVASSMVALATGPTTVVPGLLVSFPLVGAGLVMISRRTMASTTARLCVASTAMFTLAVLATQYPNGGTGEWGGRYFALALPLAVPVLLLALWEGRRRLPQGARRGAVAALVTCSLAMTAMAVGSLRANHGDKADLLAVIDKAGRSVEASGKPVVVTTAVALPRWAWPTFDRQRWLLAVPGSLGELSAGLAAAGVDRFVFVEATSERVARPGNVAVVSEASAVDGKWHILVLRSS